MKSFILTFALSLLSFHSWGLTNGVPLKANEASAVVLIEDVSAGRGTGVIVGHNLILTADHCLPSRKKANVRINGKTIVAELLFPDRRASSTNLDLALIRVKDGSLDISALPMGQIPPKKGDRIELIGYGPSYTKTNPVKEDERIIKRLGFNFITRVNPDYILFDFAILNPYNPRNPSGALPGDSGGPLLLNGKVVGIASKSIFSSSYVNLQGEVAQQFFTKARSKGWDF